MRKVLACWSGRVPTLSSSQGIVWRVPYDTDGSTFSLTAKRAHVRQEELQSIDQTFRFAMASGGDVAVASPTTISDVTISAGHYDHENTGLTTAVSSGDLLILYYQTTGNNQPFSAELELTA